VESANAEWVDLTPDFLDATGRARGILHFPIDTHLTPIGNMVAAEGLATELRSLLERR